MKISHRTLATLPRGYSIAIIPGTEIGGLPSFVAGSEGDSELLLFESPDFAPKVIADTPGGFISTWPLRIDERLFLAASTLFKPGFNAADSRLSPVSPRSGRETGADPDRRSALHPSGRHSREERCPISARFDPLCGQGRQGRLDPAGRHPPGQGSRRPDPALAMRQIVTGMNKNHGMDRARIGREMRDGYLLSCMEGLTFLPIPEDPDGDWQAESIDTDETSDAFAFDWDGDGEPEIFSISPFHGHVLAMHKKGPDGWSKQVIHDDLSFGHIVWAGNLLGGPALLAGSRRDNRELRLYRPDPGRRHRSGLRAHRRRASAPPRSPSCPMGDSKAVLYVAAHGVDEVRVIRSRWGIKHSEAISMKRIPDTDSMPQSDLQKIRVAQVRAYPKKGDLVINSRRLLEILDGIALQHPDVVVTPECFLDGYVVTRPEVTRRNLKRYAIDPESSEIARAVSAWARKNRVWVILGMHAGGRGGCRQFGPGLQSPGTDGRHL